MNRLAIAAALCAALWTAPAVPAYAIDAPVAASGDMLENLLEFERELRREKTRAEAEGELPPVGRRFGSDPYRVRRVAGHDRYLVLLRGASEVLLCDSALRVIDRAPAPRSPVGWDLDPDGNLFVCGDLSGSVHAYRVNGESVEPRYRLDVPGAVAFRDVVWLPEHRALFLLDPPNRRLVRVGLESRADNGRRVPRGTAKPSGKEPKRGKGTPAEYRAPVFRVETAPLGPGPLEMVHRADHLVVNLHLDHTLLIVPLESGRPDFSRSSAIRNDGPFWSIAAEKRRGRLTIAAGGIENRPLNRLNGEFGWVDSFLYLFTLDCDETGAYRWSESHRTDPSRFAAFNLSEIGVVMPKALAFTRGASADNAALWASGFGGERMARFRVENGRPALLKTVRVPPGINGLAITKTGVPPRTRAEAPAADETGAPEAGEAAGSYVAVTANPLLDSVDRVDLSNGRRTARLRPRPDLNAHRKAESRVGEALFYTALLTPENRTEGELSRFTCEACHFEGNVDGRVHFSGRDDIYAATRPVFGLADNVPLFSRGGAESLSAMVLAEFRVANQDRRDGFSIRKEDHPWLNDLGELSSTSETVPDSLPGVLDPLALRRAFLRFFVEFDHRPNPRRLARRRAVAASRSRTEAATGRMPAVDERVAASSAHRVSLVEAALPRFAGAALNGAGAVAGPQRERMVNLELDPPARRGLRVFQKRCADCHQPVTATRGGRALPFEEWEQALLTGEPELVWASPLFFKTGVTPYVDRAGTRVPSLRRIRYKYPYFTNGSSPTLHHLLQRFRYRGVQSRHGSPNKPGTFEPGQAGGDRLEIGREESRAIGTEFKKRGSNSWKDLATPEIEALLAVMPYF
jgi:hypothetical protein